MKMEAVAHVEHNCCPHGIPVKEKKDVWKHGSQRGNGGNVVRFGITKTDASRYGLGRFRSMRRCRGDVTGET